MESLTCLAFNLAQSNLSLMGFHSYRVMAHLLVMMSVNPSRWLMPSLPNQMTVSPEFSLQFFFFFSFQKTLFQPFACHTG